VVVPESGGGIVIPMELDNNGGVLMYSFQGPGGFDYADLGIFRIGASLTAPQLAYTTLATAWMTSDGSAVIYTLLGVDPDSPYLYTYPGVYLWSTVPAS